MESAGLIGGRCRALGFAGRGLRGLGDGRNGFIDECYGCGGGDFPSSIGVEATIKLSVDLSH